MSSQGLIIEPATAADAQGIAKVHVASWQAAYKGILPEALLASLSVSDRAAMWTQIIGEHSAQILLTKREEQIVGFVSFGASRDTDAAPNSFEIQAIYVNPSDWSTGIGNELMQTAIAHIKANEAKLLTLWVLADNVRAIRFYEKLGLVLEHGASKVI